MLRLMQQSQLTWPLKAGTINPQQESSIVTHEEIRRQLVILEQQAQERMTLMQHNDGPLQALLGQIRAYNMVLAAKETPVEAE